MTTTYYGFGVTNKGIQKFIVSNENERHLAEDEIFQTCVKNGWSYTGTFMQQGTQKQPSTMLKKFTSGQPTPRNSGRSKK